MNAASTPEFKAILKRLYDSGRFKTSGQVLRAAWQEYRSRYGGKIPSGRPYSAKIRQRNPFKKKRTNPRRKRPITGAISAKDERYKGYWIKFNHMNGSIWLEKDGAFIGYVNSLSEGRKVIDELTVSNNPRKRKPKKSCPTCGGLVSGDVCLTCIKKNPTKDVDVTFYDSAGKPYLWSFFEYRKPTDKESLRKAASKFYGKRLYHYPPVTKKNPIAVYNPRSGSVRVARRFPGVNIEMRYKRRGGEYHGEKFRHPFKAVDVECLTDGSIRLVSRSGKKLWGTVD